jgi:HAE1 family hydrophobic/amphiphilic exporter-1
MRAQFVPLAGSLLLVSLSLVPMLGIPSFGQANPARPAEAAQSNASQIDSAVTAVPPVRPFKLPPRIGVFAEARLTLEQALALALSNNNDIDASKIDLQEAQYSLIGARGAFDPTVGATGQFLKQVNPVASSLGGSTTGSVLNRNWSADPSVSGNLPWFGTTYRADFNSQRAFTNNTFTQLNPQYPTSLNMQLTQPLLRGFRYDTNRRTLDLAKKNIQLTQSQFRQRVMQIVQQTEQAYWELVYAYTNLQVQLEAVEIARQQDESNRRQEQQGLLAPIDVVAAQTQLANFEINAYAAQTALTRAENSLKALILADRSSPMWASALIPLTPTNTVPPITPLQDAVTEALRSRPETTNVQISGQINQNDTRYFREQIKPQVDLVASYTRSGLAGTQLVSAGGGFASLFGPVYGRLNELSVAAGLPPVDTGSGTTTTSGVSPILIGGYGQSLSTLWGGNFPTTQVQLRISLPLRNRAAEANLSRSVAEGRRLQNQRDQVEQTIEADVRNAMQNMQSAQMRLDAARIARQSAEEQYQSEQRQFRAGTSTLFLVQQRQNTMISSRSQERRAESDLGEAIATFEFATGSILQEHSITLP